MLKAIFLITSAAKSNIFRECAFRVNAWPLGVLDPTTAITFTNAPFGSPAATACPLPSTFVPPGLHSDNEWEAPRTPPSNTFPDKEGKGENSHAEP